MTLATQQRKTHWFRGFLWLLLLAPLFFILYGWANAYTASLPSTAVGETVYPWEKHIPFLPWTILPYWSIDLLYGLSLFLPMTKWAQRQQALRLLVATPIAILFFYLFPLTFSITKPESHGIWKTLFDALMGFDKPYNQAPSLHIMLLVIIWQIYLPFFNKVGKILWNSWIILIALSVLTTYQHHFIDIPTGFLAGIIICYVFPLEAKHRWAWSSYDWNSQMTQYLIVGVFLIVLGCFTPIWLTLLLLWVGISLFVIGFGYWGLGALVFQKKEDGIHTFPAKVLHFPYLTITKSVRFFFFKTYSNPQKITEKLYLGSHTMAQKNNYEAVFDLCSEYERAGGTATVYISYPLLDLKAPTLKDLSVAVMTLDSLIQQNQTVFIHCALGLSRSAVVVLAWLLYSGKVTSVHDAIAFFTLKGYALHLSKNHHEVLSDYYKSITS